MKPTAFICTFAILSVFTLVYGAHIILAYSEMYLIIALYASSFTLTEQNLRERHYDQGDSVGLAVAASIWLSQVTFFLKMMPRCLLFLTILRTFLETW